MPSYTAVQKGVIFGPNFGDDAERALTEALVFGAHRGGDESSSPTSTAQRDTPTRHGRSATRNEPRARARERARLTRPRIGLSKPGDEASQHGRHAARELLHFHSASRVANMEDNDEVAGRRNLAALSATLDEALALLRCTSAIGSFRVKEDRVRCGALEVVGDVSVSSRDQFRELLGERGHVERDAIDVEFLVGERSRIRRLLLVGWVVGGGMRVRVRVGRGSIFVDRGSIDVGRVRRRS